MWHDLNRNFFQNISLVMLNNFYHDQHCLKIKLRCRNRRLSQKNHWKTANWRLYDVIRQNQDMIWKRKNFQNVSLVILNNFYPDQHCLKIKLNWRNRRSSQKLTEKRQIDGCMTSYVKIRTWYEKILFKMFLWSCLTTFTMVNIS